jgi:hypothetical protein
MPSAGDPDPSSAGTAGDAALWGGSSAVAGKTANPICARQAGNHTPAARSRCHSGRDVGGMQAVIGRMGDGGIPQGQ